MLEILSHSPAQTSRVGVRIGALLGAGDVVLLRGEFGAGKTQLVKGIVQGLGSEDLVNSPSYVLINEYRAGLLRVAHVDLYRIEDPAELAGVGLDDAWAADSVALVEWAERAAGGVPAAHLQITIEHLAETKRVLRLTPVGAAYEALVARLQRQAFG